MFNFTFPIILNETSMDRIEAARIERMLRELQSDMCDLVQSGDLTPEEANDWVNHKADQWARGLG